MNKHTHLKKTSEILNQKDFSLTKEIQNSSSLSNTRETNITGLNVATQLTYEDLMFFK